MSDSLPTILPILEVFYIFDNRRLISEQFLVTAGYFAGLNADLKGSFIRAYSDHVLPG